MLSSRLLGIAIQANIPAMLIGTPGIAKTDIVKQMCYQIATRMFGGANKFPLVARALPQMVPEDLGGAQIPVHEKKIMESYTMGCVLEILEAKRGVFFVDEFGSGGQSRAAFLTAVQSRQFGAVTIPECRFVACMNPPDSGTQIVSLSAADSNRWLWIPWDLEYPAYKDYMRGGPGANADIPILSKDWETKWIPLCNLLIPQFLDKFPMWYNKPPKEEESNGPWPSPRSWTNAARMLAAVRSCGLSLSSNEAMAAVEGCVGAEAGKIWRTWIVEMDLPDAEEFIKDPSKTLTLLPQGRFDKQVACLEAVATVATQPRNDPAEYAKRWLTAWEVLDHVFGFKQDLVVSAATLLCRKEKIPPNVKWPELAGKILLARKEMGLHKNG